MEYLDQFVLDQLNFGDGIIAYIAIFILAAAPMIKVFMIIPVAIAAGLDPLGTAISSFLGTLFPLYICLLIYSKIPSLSEKLTLNTLRNRSGYIKEAINIWNSYGVPGISLVAPLFLGTNTAAMLALGFGAQAKNIAAWMCLSLVLWILIITILSCYGCGKFLGYLG
ncbi:small multi-drug export protein [Methanosalsum natronophilum]|uniref:small multi-drug export protein n=1 Tax=Methanosalsum natronophilum TaxID=768733 RepID=UPI00216A7E8C|nr:small multi-drug export protein [Methanosalsum natronophilum]MCS3923637.1 putative membrane protein [Methanosalsum natronophilum]